MSEEQVICTRCGASNTLKAVHCAGCGNNLRISSDPLEDITVFVEESAHTSPQPHHHRRALFLKNMRLVLRVVETGTEIACDLSRNTLTLGRKATDTKTPHLDFSEQDGATLGVSRQHARITRMNATLMLQDVGSSNGTSINGERIHTGKPYILCDGDEVRLGSLCLAVVFAQ